MIDQYFYKTLFKSTFSDPVEITLWDGEKVHYGEGKPVFRIKMNEVIPKAEIVQDPSMAMGKAYMTGKLEVEGDLKRVVQSIYEKQGSFLGNGKLYKTLLKTITNNKKHSKENIQFHYDIGNDFYKLWLDETMTYSCAYFKHENESLADAQRNKVAYILKKLNLQKDQTLLDIGCGWGELIVTAAKKYGVKATGITLSNEQYARVKERIIEENLIDLVDVKLMDYRDIQGSFDRVVSVGMLEHVGQDHLEEYFEKVYDLLADGGISMLHCITCQKEGASNSWIDQYIFPGGYVPGVAELVQHITSKQFHLVDLESLRRHYEKTLDIWASNFEGAIEEVKKMKDETFIRMWRLYLNACAASFAAGNIDLSQLIFTKGVNNEMPMTREYMYQ